MKHYYLFLLPALAYFILFCYKPMYGIVIAFKDYNFADGIVGSPWVGWKNFQDLFSDMMFYRVLRNTLIISLLKLAFGLPAPIILALLLEEVGVRKLKKWFQTISYLPYFISWVILASIIAEVLSPSRGIVNYVLTLFGMEPVYFLTDPHFFRPMLIFTHVWATVGWSSIVYIAAISGIDQQLYESAVIDGANRFKQIIHITLPSIMPVITVVSILSLGGVLSAGFDQIFNLYNPLVYNVADVIDTYVYRVGLLSGGQFSYSTAVGLFQSGIGFLLLLLVNTIVRRFNESTLW